VYKEKQTGNEYRRKQDKSNTLLRAINREETNLLITVSGIMTSFVYWSEI
jgi:hypothetical protein